MRRNASWNVGAVKSDDLTDMIAAAVERIPHVRRGIIGLYSLANRDRCICRPSVLKRIGSGIPRRVDRIAQRVPPSIECDDMPTLGAAFGSPSLFLRSNFRQLHLRIKRRAT
jgi:hypothetical protein